MTNAPPPPDWQDRQQVAIAEIGPPAGFWIRFVAYSIDFIIVAIATFVILCIYFVAILLWDESIDQSQDSPFIVGSIILMIVGFFAISWLYEALMTSSRRGATLGKLALALRVVRADGAQLSFGRASARHFLKVIITPLVPFAIGYLMAAFTNRKRALHDVLAETLVIRLL